MSTTKQLKKDSIVPFIKLLESNGVLHTEHFIGMGIHDEKLYLVKMHARPERVSVMNGEFAFLNKKADGPSFDIENGQNREQGLKAYQFYGDSQTHFTEVMAVPESEMQRVLMMSALKEGLAQLETGAELNMEQMFTHLFADLSQAPNAAELLMQEDPSISPAEAALAVELSQKLHNGELNADEFLAQAGVPVDVLERAELHASAERMEPQPDSPATPREEARAPRESTVRPNGPDALIGNLFSRFGWSGARLS